jgi:hypothetical protein
VFLLAASELLNERQGVLSVVLALIAVASMKWVS